MLLTNTEAEKKISDANDGSQSANDALDTVVPPTKSCSSLSRGSKLKARHWVPSALEGLTLSDAPKSRADIRRHDFASKIPPPLNIPPAGSGDESNNGNEPDPERVVEGIENNYRERIQEFLRGKESITELKSEDFEKLCDLGSGQWGAVSKVRYLPTSILMARKVIRLALNATESTQLLRELETLHNCASPFIIGFYGAYFEGMYLNICMEYVDGGSLDTVLRHAGRIPEPIVSRILYAVLRGLAYMHKSLKMIHRDVKPSNILMNRNGEIKLCDLGASGKLIDSVAHSFIGSRNYMAPERITAQPYNTRSDVWSLGLTLIEITTGHYPLPPIEDEEVYFTAFSRNREANLAEHITAAKEGRKLPPVTASNMTQLSIIDMLQLINEQVLPTLPTTCFTNEFIDLCASCLHRKSEDRASLEALLQHPFVLTMGGTCVPHANRHSSIRFSDYGAFVANRKRNSGRLSNCLDPQLADIEFYLSMILLPLE